MNPIKTGVPAFFVALNMRAGLVVIAPLIPILHRELHLSTVEISVLTGLPILCFSLSAFLMRWVGRWGNTNRIITWALGILGTSLALRASGSVLALMIFSISMGIAIAILNYMMPVWVRENAPAHAGLLTGIYVAILGLGAGISIACAVPLSQVGSLSWKFSMIPWAVLAILTAMLWQVKLPQSPTQTYDSQSVHFWSSSLMKHPSAWALTLFFGLQSMIFYSTSTWLPTILLTKGFSLTQAGFIVSITGLVGSATGTLVPHYASRHPNLRSILVGVSLVMVLGFFLFTCDSGWRTVLWLGIANIGISISFPMALVLAVMKGGDSVSTRTLSIMMQSIGYLLAALAPGILGGIFDLSGSWTIAMIFVLVLAVLHGLVSIRVGRTEKLLSS